MHGAKKNLIPHIKPEKCIQGACPIPPICHLRPIHHIPHIDQGLLINTLPPVPKPRIGQGRAGIRRKPRVALPKPEVSQKPAPPIPKPTPRAVLPLTETVTQSQGSTLPCKQVPTMPRPPMHPTPAGTTLPLEPKLDPRPNPPYPEPFFRPPPKPPDETIIKDSRKDLQDFDLDRKVEFEENSPHQEGIISETYERPDASLIQDPPELKI